jgi:hypothetical protein
MLKKNECVLQALGDLEQAAETKMNKKIVPKITQQEMI